MAAHDPPDPSSGPPRADAQAPPSPPSPPSPEAVAGWCEAASRLLAPLLASAEVKTRLRVLVQHLDPDYAPVLVRTLFRTDPEIPLGLVSALPRVANLAIEAAAELGRALGAFPPALLGSFAGGLLGDLRARTLGEALGRAARLVGGLPARGGDPAAFWSDLAAGFSAGYGAGTPDADAPDAGAPETEPSALAAHARGLAVALGALLDAHPELFATLAEALRESASDHPELWRQGIAPLVAPLHELLHAHRQGEGESR